MTSLSICSRRVRRSERERKREREREKEKERERELLKEFKEFSIYAVNAL